MITSDNPHPENKLAENPPDRPEASQPQTEQALIDAGKEKPAEVANSEASSEKAAHLHEDRPEPQKSLDVGHDEIPVYHTSSLYDYPLYHQLPNGDLCVSSEVEPEIPGENKPRFKLGWKKRPEPSGWDSAKYPVHELIAGAVDAKIFENRQAQHIDDQLAGRVSKPDGNRTRAEEECFRKGNSQRDPKMTETHQDTLTDSTVKATPKTPEEEKEAKPGLDASNELKEKTAKSDKKKGDRKAGSPDIG